MTTFLFLVVRIILAFITHKKIQPRSTPCIFLVYPTHHRGLCCYDLSTQKIIISRHVTFDESIFPYDSVTPAEPLSCNFLFDIDKSPITRQILQPPVPPPSTNNPLSSYSQGPSSYTTISYY